MKYLFILLALAGCKNSCQDSDSPASVLALQMSQEWGCDELATKEWLSKWMEPKGLCGEQKSVTLRGPMMGNLLCPAVINRLQGNFFKMLPAEIKCDPKKVGSNVAADLEALCKSALSK